MNRIATFLLTAAIVLSFSFINGPGPGINENSFIIDGDGFKNQLVQLEIKSNDFTTNYYARGTYNYQEEYENMTVKVSGKNTILPNSPIAGFNIDFNKFNGVGHYTLDSAVSLNVFFKKNTLSNEYDQFYILDEGEININSYGKVGELIEGTFSGKLIKLNYNAAIEKYWESETEVMIKDGKFSVVRFPDYHWNAPKSTGKEPEEFKKDKKKKKSKE